MTAAERRGYMAGRKAALAARGLCVRCGREPPKIGRKTCQGCIDREYAGVQRRRKQKTPE